MRRAREIENFVRYVGSKGKKREGFKLVDGGALIPEEVLEVRKEERTLDLTKLVKVVEVNTGSGKYPLIRKSGGKMVSVAELEKNPELSKPIIDDIKYEIKTYRGYVAVSQEIIDDADYDIAGEILEEIADQELNTKNIQIADILKTAEPKAVTGIDGLKDLSNTQIDGSYETKAIVSASLFNELDKAKDNNGRYLLQSDVTAENGKRLFGRHDIEILDDDVIGNMEGDLVGFIGDPKEFIILFDRKRATAKWIDDNIYGELLTANTRFDIKKLNDDAGFYIRYTPEVK